MNLKSVKKTSDITLQGVTAEIEKADGVLKSVRLTDAAGNLLIVRVDTYSLSVLVQAPPPTETRHRLTGTVAGVPVQHDFEDSYEAEKAKREYEAKVRHEEDAALTVDPRAVAVGAVPGAARRAIQDAGEPLGMKTLPAR